MSDSENDSVVVSNLENDPVVASDLENDPVVASDLENDWIFYSLTVCVEVGLGTKGYVWL